MVRVPRREPNPIKGRKRDTSLYFAREENFGGLSAADRSVLDAFLSLERVSRIQQIKTMLQYKIYPLPFYRAIGAMLFLPKGEGERG